MHQWQSGQSGETLHYVLIWVAFEESPCSKGDAQNQDCNSPDARQTPSPCPDPLKRYGGGGGKPIRAYKREGEFSSAKIMQKTLACATAYLGSIV